MNGELLFNGIGELDDAIIEKSIRKMARIKRERCIRICSAFAAALLVVSVPSGIVYSRITSHNAANFSLPPVWIDGEIYNAHTDHKGLPEPSEKLAGEFLGEYGDGDIIRVYKPKTPADHLIGELDGTYFYLIKEE